jgi:polysaccharide biosynthesis/export protein PslD
MKNYFRTGALFLCALLTGCGGNHVRTDSTYVAPTVHPSTRAVLRVGDKVTIQLTGVPDGGFFNEKQIPNSGLISLPYLDQEFQAAGVNPADLGEQIRSAYKDKRIYKNPVVTVLPEVQYINVGGDVRSPSTVPYRPDATIMSILNTCGGFTEFANKRSVRIIRGSQVIYVDCIKAVEDPGQDPPVFPGDQIFVPRTLL